VTRRAGTSAADGRRTAVMFGNLTSYPVEQLTAAVLAPGSAPA
jgi:hypothetical protein